MPPEAPAYQGGMRKETTISHGPDGHSYHFNKLMKGGRVHARCHLYFKKRCTGAASISPVDGSFLGRGHHNHPPQRFLRHERLLRHAILRRCRDRNDLTNLHDIYHEERRHLRSPDEVVANMPFNKIRRSMESARREGLPPLPACLTELARLLNSEGTKFLTESCDGEDNIYAGVVGRTAENTRCVILMSQRQRRYSNSGTVKIVFSDATFIAPRGCGSAQLFNLVTLRRRHTNPHIICLGSVLMQSRTTQCYVTALRAIHDMCPDFRPNQNCL